MNIKLDALIAEHIPPEAITYENGVAVIDFTRMLGSSGDGRKAGFDSPTSANNSTTQSFSQVSV